ncbi:uncharacterized protein L201_006516 [Kwoniella dendrophila CBS 6074]|uniref:Secretion-regulating guanine nucleotide exchange factor n=1 Tax=Kwoniella dendrophila CBS 6074 TaxID=1295534 RepID=A0AAX4K1R3_9TREE
MAPSILACGSNAASHLAINHPDDVSVLTSTVYHPSLPPISNSSQIVDLILTSAHSLLLISPETSPDETRPRNILLGAGTNKFGQLGPRCALWDDIKPESRWKPLNLLNSAGIEGNWEPVQIASTWTTSFVVYQRFIASKPVNESTESGSSSTISNNDLNKLLQENDNVGQIVISCGSNDFGELGSSSKSPLILDAPAEIPISQASQKPTIVDLGLKADERVQLIKGGQRHVIAVINDKKNQQKVIGWGASRKGELDPSSTLSHNLSVGSSISTSKGKGKGKAVSRLAISSPTVINLPIQHGDRIIDISLGASHTLALLSNGTVLAWGSNLKGQISGIHELKDIKSIAATWGGSYFLTKSDQVYSQGSNSHSQLLRGGIEVNSEIGQIDLPKGWKPKDIFAGSEHLLVHMIKDNGESQEEEEEGLWTGGWNEHGNLGLGDQADRSNLQKVDFRGKINGLWGGCASTWVWTD